MTEGEHSAVHSTGWNTKVQGFIDREAQLGRTYTRREILRFGAEMRREFKLKHLKVMPYEDQKK